MKDEKTDFPILYSTATERGSRAKKIGSMTVQFRGAIIKPKDLKTNIFKPTTKVVFTLKFKTKRVHQLCSQKFVKVMLNSEKNNPRLMDMKRTYDKKFGEKPAHQESDVTSWSAVTVFLLHAFSAICAGYASQFFGLSGMEQTVVSVVWFALMVVLEVFKSKYSERYHIAIIKSLDDTLKEDEQERAYDRAKVTKNILLVFWTISLSIVVFAASQMALKNAPEVELLSYDKNLQSVLLQKQVTLSQAQERSAKLATIKGLQADVSKAAEEVKQDKSFVDRENIARRTAHGNGLGIYIFFGFLLGLGIEMGIYYMRRFHETKQYEIYQSLPFFDTKKGSNPASVAHSNDELALLKVKIRELESTVKTQEAYIRDLTSQKSALERLIRPEVLLNGSPKQ